MRKKRLTRPKVRWHCFDTKAWRDFCRAAFDFLLVQEEVKKRIRSQGWFLLNFSACDIGFNGAEINFGNAYISSILWLFTDGVVQYLDVYRRDISTPRPLTHHVTTHPEISHNWLSSNTIKWPQRLATISDQETEDRFMQYQRRVLAVLARSLPRLTMYCQFRSKDRYFIMFSWNSIAKRHAFIGVFSLHPKANCKLWQFHRPGLVDVISGALGRKIKVVIRDFT